MFDKLEKHHLGFIIPLEERPEIERQFGKPFHYDATQKTHVLFIYDKVLRTYMEYICQEGRVAKQKPGFAHICYNLKDRVELQRFEEFIQEGKRGYKLTELEKSGSQECGFIIFYYVKNQGVVELNIPQKE
ncbi:MAG TPA: hypothetical protein DD723_10585 [Candidatus Omnitrophica bacterium]|nr:MAG: hypothetical protein A2Z81_09765 [Omnitrophica WOR_2 bacterium GWA2_45_18]OGX19923.1 MAG: hypothetical protein A2Y04_04240 [Omnitrophica WOR_2 bacterium GWC2_45_7]HBR15963.1 hypothetical protein [Candidatus Omnitrophota bacterium]